MYKVYSKLFEYMKSNFHDIREQKRKSTVHLQVLHNRCMILPQIVRFIDHDAKCEQKNQNNFRGQVAPPSPRFTADACLFQTACLCVCLSFHVHFHLVIHKPLLSCLFYIFASLIMHLFP